MHDDSPHSEACELPTPPAPAISQTTISANSLVKGELNIKGDLIIEGEVIGRVIVSGRLTIGKKGSVKSEGIECNTGEVSGQIQGKIHASELLIIHSNGYITGDLEVKDLIIEKGGRFDGKCQYIATETTLPCKPNVPDTPKVKDNNSSFDDK